MRNRNRNRFCSPLVMGRPKANLTTNKKTHKKSKRKDLTWFSGIYSAYVHSYKAEWGVLLLQNWARPTCLNKGLIKPNRLLFALLLFLTSDYPMKIFVTLTNVIQFPLYTTEYMTMFSYLDDAGLVDSRICRFLVIWQVLLLMLSSPKVKLNLWISVTSRSKDALSAPFH